MNKDSAENKQFVCMKNPIGKDLVLEKNDFWTCNGWTIIAGIEFILIIIVLLFKRRNSKFEKLRNLKREISGKEVDFTNILNSAFNSKELYDILKVKCHPDRFIDSNKNALANEIFQEISKNKNNIKKLEELKVRAEKELNVKF